MYTKIWHGRLLLFDSFSSSSQTVLSSSEVEITAGLDPPDLLVQIIIVATTILCLIGYDLRKISIRSLDICAFIRRGINPRNVTERSNIWKKNYHKSNRLIRMPKKIALTRFSIKTLFLLLTGFKLKLTTCHVFGE